MDLSFKSRHEITGKDWAAFILLLLFLGFWWWLTFESPYLFGKPVETTTTSVLSTTTSVLSTTTSVLSTTTSVPYGWNTTSNTTVNL